jgi:hypothetical protein
MLLDGKTVPITGAYAAVVGVLPKVEATAAWVGRSQPGARASTRFMIRTSRRA